MEQISTQNDVAVHKQQTRTSTLLIPVRTMNKLNSAKQSTLQVPTVSATKFKRSTHKIMTSMVSVFGTQDQTFFAALQDESEYGGSSYEDTESVGTAKSFDDSNFDIDRDAIMTDYAVKDGTSPPPPPEQKDASDIVIVLSPTQQQNKSRKSSRSLQNAPDLLIEPTIDMKLLKERLEQEVKQEMETLEKDLERQYNAEFEKKKLELIHAHEESFKFVQYEHQKVSEELEKLKQDIEQKQAEMHQILPQWKIVLAHILGF